MAPTLLMRLIGPMQSWGTQSDFTHRDTGLEPSKSGVIGLLCAALGRPRDADLSDLAALRMGVRVDREGILQKDYHTAQNVLKAGGGIKNTELSDRFYLSDAAFLVGLEGEDRALLEKLDAALRRPRWLLFLGRKAFPPSKPVHMDKPEEGVRDLPLEDALKLTITPRLGCERRGDDKRVRLVIEPRPGGIGEVTRRDWPLSFARGRRQFLERQVSITYSDPVEG